MKYLIYTLKNFVKNASVTNYRAEDRIITIEADILIYFRLRISNDIMGLIEELIEVMEGILDELLGWLEQHLLDLLPCKIVRLL